MTVGLRRVVLVWMLALPGSALFAQDQTGRSIGGTVVARSSRQPVAGAIITVVGSSATATTQPSGRFRIEGVSPGNVDLVVRAHGFLDGRVSGVNTDANSADVRIEL